MNILHTSFECYPLAKVGGLADVVGALPKYQNRLGHKAKVAAPFFENEYTNRHDFETIYEGSFIMGNDTSPFSIQKGKALELGFELLVVHIPGLLDRAHVYGYEDDVNRYLGFQLALLTYLAQEKVQPDILHCHDHHTGLIPFLISHTQSFSALKDIPTVLTIHNAQYQGQISYDELYKLPEFDDAHKGLLDWHDCINPLASAIKCAWRVTTVSPSYMQELQHKANGLEDLLAAEKDKCIGILNGIDAETWDTSTDPKLAKNYTHTSVVSGKKGNKKWLCDEFDLDPKLPLFGFIGRLVGEKGADLLPEVVQQTLDELEVNMLILGSGFKDVEVQLEALKSTYKGKYNAHIGYDESLSHKVYGGADFLIMPSRVEPCGLNQMYSLRYGTIPIVRRTGGLQDTVIDMGDDGFGFCHEQASVWDICYSMKRATALYDDQARFKKVQKEIMKIDHSWDRSAQEYINVYQTI